MNMGIMIQASKNIVVLIYIAFIVGLFTLPFFSVGAQEPTQPPLQRPRRVFPPEIEMGEVIRIDTDLIVLDVTVTDANGLPVRGLEAKDFKLYEDGVERPVSFLNPQIKTDLTQPLAIVLALDVSGSITGYETAQLQSAVRTFMKTLGSPQNLFSVMTFGMHVNTLQGFTNDPQKIENSLAKLAKEPNGLTTHIYDAVDDAIRALVRKAPKTRQNRLVKKAVVVISDGFSVGDTVSPATVIERANRENISIYTMTLPSYSRVIASKELMPLPTPLDVSGLVEKTGGIRLYVNSKDFDSLFRALAEEVSSTYTLAFYPSEEKRGDNRFHSIRVAPPLGYTIRQSRTGYHASKERR
jgi:Ca-activated chloride channel homolog